MLAQLNTAIVVFLNGVLRNHYLLARIVEGLALNPIARGVPVFVPLMVIWFSTENTKHRGRILLGLVGVCVATLVSVMLQKRLHVDVRPFFNPKLHLYLLSQEIIQEWGRINSFPSDTATLYFSLSTVVFLEWRVGGAFAYGWSFLSAGICRMALGFHYPSDILAGIALGIATAYFFSNMHGLASRVQRLLEGSNIRVAWIHAALFLFIADAYTLFPGLQGVMRFLTMLERHW